MVPPVPGAERDHVYTLRTVEDSKAIIDAAGDARTAVVVGSGFIGLETAASLTQRGIQVHVVTRDTSPLAGVLGDPLSRRVRTEHEEHGTTFHTGTTLARIDEGAVLLDDGTELSADLVVLGTGVSPRVELAEAAGLEVDDGVVVDRCLRTGAPGIYAAGDIARWPDAHDGRLLRVEHWVLAQRHGQHVARNILSGDRPFTDVPFFWSAHYGIKIRYVGHAEDWDEMDVDGDVEALDCAVRYRKDGRTLAVATVGRDVESLAWEAEREKDNAS